MLRRISTITFIRPGKSGQALLDCGHEVQRSLSKNEQTMLASLLTAKCKFCQTHGAPSEYEPLPVRFYLLLAEETYRLTPYEWYQVCVTFANNSAIDWNQFRKLSNYRRPGPALIEKEVRKVGNRCFIRIPCEHNDCWWRLQSSLLEKGLR